MKYEAELVWGFALVLVAWMAYAVGVGAGRQEVPMACEARCEVTMQAGKVLKTVCPDSLGRMP